MRVGGKDVRLLYFAFSEFERMSSIYSEMTSFKFGNVKVTSEVYWSTS